MEVAIITRKSRPNEDTHITLLLRYTNTPKIHFNHKLNFHDDNVKKNSKIPSENEGPFK